MSDPIMPRADKILSFLSAPEPEVAMDKFQEIADRETMPETPLAKFLTIAERFAELFGSRGDNEETPGHSEDAGGRPEVQATGEENSGQEAAEQDADQNGGPEVAVETDAGASEFNPVSNDPELVYTVDRPEPLMPGTTHDADMDQEDAAFDGSSETDTSQDSSDPQEGGETVFEETDGGEHADESGDADPETEHADAELAFEPFSKCEITGLPFVGEAPVCPRHQEDEAWEDVDLAI